MEETNTQTEASEAVDAAIPSDAERVARAVAKIQELPDEAGEATGAEGGVVKEEIAREKSEKHENPAAKVEETKLAPNIAAILKREKRQKQEHETRLAELRKREEEIEAKAKMAASLEEMKRQAIMDPVAFYQSLGVDKLADVGTQLLYKEIGNAPAEIKEKFAVRRLEMELQNLARKNEEMQKQFQERESLSEQKAALRQYEASVHGYLDAVPDDFPHVKVSASKDARGTANMLMQIAIEHARQNPSGLPLKPAELVALLESGLEEEMKPFETIYERRQKTTSSAEKKSAGPSRTLSNGKTATPTTKRNPAESDDERLKRATEALERAVAGQT